MRQVKSILFDFFKNYISSGLGEHEDGYLLNQVYFINTFSFIGFMTLVVFSGYNLSVGNSFLAGMELVVALLVAGNGVYLRLSKNISLCSTGVLLSMLLLSFLLVVKGGLENTGIYWLYIFPILAFFLKGPRQGFVWITLFGVGVMGLALLARFEQISVAYSFVELRQFTVSMVVLSLMTYFYARRVHENQEELKKRVEEAVTENRKKDHLLIQQSRLAAMGEMIGNIAHQWRQPLTTVGMILQGLPFIQRKGELDDKRLAENIEKGMEQIIKMSTTIDDFRNFFKPDKKQENFLVNKSIGEVLNLSEGMLNAHHIKVETTVEKPMTVTGYPGEFSQVLLNIINNARDAIVESGVREGKITIDALQEKNNAKISICDNGGGIPEAIINEVFDPYFTTKEEGKGTGIGLYMSKTMIEENMNGRLCAVNSERGACFTIELPMGR